MWQNFWAIDKRKIIIFTIFYEYFYYWLFVKRVKDFLILYDKIYIKIAIKIVINF